MPTVALRYRFRQPLDAPAEAAFAWCTDFGPSDGPLFAQRTERSVRRLADGALVLTDITYPNGRRRRIRRLVRIDPARRSWTNTHLDGPFRHSQFWYRIVPNGPRRSRLEFVGLALESVPRRLSGAQVAALAAERGRADSGAWRRYLAPALARDLAARSPRGSPRPLRARRLARGRP